MRCGLIEPDLSKLVGWGFGDFIFHSETDVISDANKIHRFGFIERMDSAACLIAALGSLGENACCPKIRPLLEYGGTIRVDKGLKFVRKDSGRSCAERGSTSQGRESRRRTPISSRSMPSSEPRCLNTN